MQNKTINIKVMPCLLIKNPELMKDKNTEKRRLFT